jgi:ribosomal protein S27AE
MVSYYFIDYERNNELVEKCPSCGEDFVLHNGGSQCKESICTLKKLESKHREVTQSMVNHLIPKYTFVVNFPNTPLTDENKNDNLK